MSDHKNSLLGLLCVGSLLGCAMLGGCTDKPKEQPAKTVKPIAVSTITAASSSETVWVDTLGKAEGARESEVRAQVSGILKKISYREGDFVKKGTVLFEIDDAPYRAALDTAKAQLRQSEVQYEQAKREAKRYAELHKHNAVSLKQFQDAQSSEKSALATVAANKAKVRDAEIKLGYTKVVAESSGTVSKSEINPGALVNSSSTLLATVSQPDNLRIGFRLSERDAGGNAITKDNKVRLLVAGKYIDCRLDYVAPTVDPKTATLALRADAGNASGIMPGQLVHVQIQTATIDKAWRVPQKAVLQRPDGSYQVFVVSEGKALAKTVKLGNWKDTDWIVTSGLDNGDMVIVNQIQRLRNGTPVTAGSGSKNSAQAK